MISASATSVSATFAGVNSTPRTSPDPASMPMRTLQPKCDFFLFRVHAASGSVPLRAPASDCGRRACASLIVASISVPRFTSMPFASNCR